MCSFCYRYCNRVHHQETTFCVCSCVLSYWTLLMVFREGQKCIKNLPPWNITRRCLISFIFKFRHFKMLRNFDHKTKDIDLFFFRVEIDDGLRGKCGKSEWPRALSSPSGTSSRPEFVVTVSRKLNISLRRPIFYKHLISTAI